MVKAKVLIDFTDRENQKHYTHGEVITLTVKRFNEITVKGNGRFIALVEEKIKKED